MEELTIEEKAKRYNESLESATIAYKDEDKHLKATLERIFPELKVSDDERVRKELIEFLDEIWHLGKNANFDKWDKADCSNWLAWLEKQSNNKPIERKEFTSIPFGAFDSELIEQMFTIPDGYVATIKGNKIHIKREYKTATEAVKEEKVDNANKVESKFKVGDWIVKKDGKNFCNGSRFVQITNIDGTICYFDCGSWLTEDKIRPWSIQDAQDGDLIYVSTEEKSIHAIFDTFDNGIIYFHCYLCGDFTQGGYMPMGDVELVSPLPKTHYQRFFQKMKEAGYEWNSEKKELKKT